MNSQGSCEKLLVFMRQSANTGFLPAFEVNLAALGGNSAYNL